MEKRLLAMEDERWIESNEMFAEYLNQLGGGYKAWVEASEMEVSDIPGRFIKNSNLYIGDAKLAETMYKYELYKKVMNLAGDIAEVGIWQGDTFLLWAKLVKIFEPYNSTQVYGFDWFKGMEPNVGDNQDVKGRYKGDYGHLQDIIKWLKLENIALVQNMDIITGIKKWVEDRPHLRFKLLYIDCGMKDVMEAAYEYLYPRLVNGGVLLIDHYNFKVSPSESDIIEKYIGDNIVHQMPWARQPTGYVIKNVN